MLQRSCCRMFVIMNWCKNYSPGIHIHWRHRASFEESRSQFHRWKPRHDPQWDPHWPTPATLALPEIWCKDSPRRSSASRSWHRSRTWVDHSRRTAFRASARSCYCCCFWVVDHHSSWRIHAFLHRASTARSWWSCEGTNVVDWRLIQQQRPLRSFASWRNPGGWPDHFPVALLQLQRCCKCAIALPKARAGEPQQSMWYCKNDWSRGGRALKNSFRRTSSTTGWSSSSPAAASYKLVVHS